MPRSKQILLAVCLAVLVAAAAVTAVTDHAHDNLCGRLCAACHVGPVADENHSGAPQTAPPAPAERLLHNAPASIELDPHCSPAPSRGPPSFLL